MAEGHSDTQDRIEGLRERLTELLAEWGAEMSGVLTELEQCRTQLRAVEGDTAERDREMASLGERLRGQDELINALKGDAEAASELRRDLNERELEIERMKSELDSKKELIGALRRDAENTERLKSEAKRRDGELEELRAAKNRLEAEVRRLEEAVASLTEAADADSSEEAAEIESLRTELEARKSMIKSLRADAERAHALEGRLEEKRDIVRQLEATINRHANTIVELKRNADVWKRKYRSLKGVESTTVTNAELPAFADTDIPEIPEPTGDPEANGERTIAIDMRRSLIEARRTAQSRQQK